MLWGKAEPYHPLICHMIDVGCMAQTLLQNSCFSPTLSKAAELFDITEEEFLSLAGYLLSLHDIGKCHPLFQQKNPNLEFIKYLQEQGLLQKDDPSTYHHEFYSYQWILGHLREDFGWKRPQALMWAQVLGLHHQRETSNLKAPEIDTRIRNYWFDLQRTLSDLLGRVFQVDKRTITNCAHADKAGTILLGLLVLSDWLASNTNFFPFADKVENMDEYVQNSRVYATKAIDTLDLVSIEPIMHYDSFRDVWPMFSQEVMRPLQKSCEEFCAENITPGLLLIEAPMGEGKTEAALYIVTQWAKNSGKQGAYVALPTESTSNQMYERVKEFLSIQNKNAAVKLLHGRAWLIDENTIENAPIIDSDAHIAKEWFRPSRRGLLVPWAVGTVDQCMMAAMLIRYGILRLFGLYGKVLIIDEVHAYDAYMTTIIKRLLEWCGTMDIPVILLSATLPYVRRQELIKAYCNIDITVNNQYPLLTHVSPSGRVTQKAVRGTHMHHEITLHLHKGALGNFQSVAGNALNMVANGGCLAIIVNTVGDAQRLYHELKLLSTDGTPILLYHARFCTNDRMMIEKRCLEAFDKRSLLNRGHPDNCTRPGRAILVATQVVEQSLDLDFDVMISALAPIDLLLQRSGRLHRHAGRYRPSELSKPAFHVLLPEHWEDLGGTGRVYSPWILYQTAAVLEGRNNLLIPDEIRELVESVYLDREPPADHPYISEWDKLQDKLDNDSLKAQRYLLAPPHPRRFGLWAQQERYDDPDNALSWFRSQTRLGNDSQRVILLDSGSYDRVCAKGNSLNKQETKKIMKHMASIPRWWLNGTQTCNENLISNGEGLLKGFALLAMNNGVWEGVDDLGRKVNIIKNPELGILFERE